MRDRQLPDEDHGLRKRIALDCEFKLVETLGDPDSQGDWVVVDSAGSIYYACLFVDERLDCPVVDVCDAQTGILARRFVVSVNCRSAMPTLPDEAFPGLESQSVLLQPSQLDKDSDVDAAFCQITGRIDRNDLAEKAESLLKQGDFGLGAAFVFAHCPGGLVGHTIRKMVVETTTGSENPTDYLRRVDELAERLMAYYGFAKDWVPPRLLVRDALALTVHRREVMRQLEKQVGECPQFSEILEQEVAMLDDVEYAFQISDERTGKVLREMSART